MLSSTVPTPQLPPVAAQARVRAAAEAVRRPDAHAAATRASWNRRTAAVLATAIGLGGAAAAAHAQGASPSTDAPPALDPAPRPQAPVGFRPGLTEGTGITPRGHLVVEVGASVEDGADGSSRNARRARWCCTCRSPRARSCASACRATAGRGRAA
jgi:hypothetical protein